MTPSEVPQTSGGRSGRLAAGSLEALLENARLLHSSLELEDLLRSLLRSVMGRLVVTRGLLALIEGDPSTSKVETVAVSRGFRDLPVGSLFDAEHCRTLGAEHLLPIGDPHHPVGHLALGRPIKGELADQDLEFLEALLGIAAGAIANARAHQQARALNRQLDQRVQQLRTLLDLGRSLTSTLEASQVAQALGLTLAGQWLLRRYAVVAWNGDASPVQRLKGMKIPAAAEIREELGALAGPAAIEELPQGALRSALEAQEAELVVPLLSGDKVVGLVVLGAPAGQRTFEAGDRDFLAGLAAQAVVAFENAWYFEETLQREKMERDLALAGEIQQRLFPTELPQPTGFGLAAHNRPASQVGGDYYDVLSVSSGENQRYLICVADISGKGMAASLLMSNLQATLRALLDTEPDLAGLVLRTSRLLYATTPASKYATAFFLLLDPRTGACRYVNAGHNEGLVVRRDGTIEEMTATGFPVGLMGIGEYRAEEFRLEPGDCVALYSDGVNEANDQDEQEFGMDRLKAALVKRRKKSAQDIVDGLFEEVDAFATGAPQYDDITALVAKRF